MTMVAVSFSFAQTVYTPVDAGSKVHFVIKNFGIKTGGNLSGIKGLIKFDPVNFSASGFDITVDANTINTDNEMRDGHLKESEYFDVEKYKTIHFISTKVVRSSKAGRFYVFGNLTIKNVTKPVEFAFGATLKNGGYIFVHDYNNDGYKGAKEAVEEFCKENNISRMPLPDAGGTVVISK